MKLKYNVLNMHCTGCKKRIKSYRKMLKGVKEVEGKYKTGEVIVTLKNDKLKEDIKKLLNDLEFEVVSYEVI